MNRFRMVPWYLAAIFLMVAAYGESRCALGENSFGVVPILALVCYFIGRLHQQRKENSNHE